jgi:hypothetical protein
MSSVVNWSHQEMLMKVSAGSKEVSIKKGVLVRDRSQKADGF